MDDGPKYEIFLSLLHTYHADNGTSNRSMCGPNHRWLSDRSERVALEFLARRNSRKYDFSDANSLLTTPGRSVLRHVATSHERNFWYSHLRAQGQASPRRDRERQIVFQARQRSYPQGPLQVFHRATNEDVVPVQHLRRNLSVYRSHVRISVYLVHYIHRCVLQSVWMAWWRSWSFVPWVGATLL